MFRRRKETEDAEDEVEDEVEEPEEEKDDEDEKEAEEKPDEEEEKDESDQEHPETEVEDEEKEDEAEKDDDEQEEQDEKDDEDDKDKDGDDEESEETFAAIECQTICSICIFTCPRNMAMPNLMNTWMPISLPATGRSFNPQATAVCYDKPWGVVDGGDAAGGWGKDWYRGCERGHGRQNRVNSLRPWTNST